MKKTILLAAGVLLTAGLFAAPVTAFQAPQHMEKQTPGPHKKHKKRHHHGKKHHHTAPARKPA